MIFIKLNPLCNIILYIRYWFVDAPIIKNSSINLGVNTYLSIIRL